MGNLGKMNKLVALSFALVALVAFATAAPVASRRAIFFEEQRAGKVEYTNWPPVACKADGDCVGLNASYCMNDKTKTAPFFCHTPLLTLTSGLARTGKKSVVPKLLDPQGLAVDQENKRIVFTTSGVGDGVVTTMKFDGSDVQHVANFGFAPMGVSFGVIPY